MSEGKPFEAQLCSYCGTWHYHNSKPCAAALVVENGKVLLARRGIEPYKGCWDVPGGFLEAGEHPEDGVRRELLEEAGLEIRLQGLLGVYVDRYGQDGVWLLNFYYIAETVGGIERAMDDVETLEWFEIGELPEKFAFEHQNQVMRDFRQQMANKA